VGSGAPGEPGLLPERADLPFVDLPDPTAAGIPDPLGSLRITLPANGGYRDRHWAADWYAWTVLTDFVANTAWDGIAALPDPATYNVTAELNDLVTAASNERSAALGEIVAQSGEAFLSYFTNLLAISPRSHPQTWRVINISSLTALFVVMHYKKKYGRPRPSMLAPALLPPIAVPGHASYPSGHATQAHLIKHCVLDVLALTSAAEQATYTSNLTALAQRVARNREIAGLHYKSDSDAGELLAHEVHSLLATRPAYVAAYVAAQAEWP